MHGGEGHMTAERGRGCAVGDLPKLREKLSVLRRSVSCVVSWVLSRLCFEEEERRECCGAYIAMH